MRYVIYFLLIVFVSCGTIEDEPIQIFSDFSAAFNTDSLNERLITINTPLDIFDDEGYIPVLSEPDFKSSVVARESETNYTQIIEGEYDGRLDLNEGDYVCIADGATVNGGLNMVGGTLIVYGNITTAGFSGTGGTVIVKNGGSIDFVNLYIRDNINLIVYGHVYVPEGVGITVNGSLENYSTINCERVRTNDVSRLVNYGSLNVITDVTIKGIFENNGKFNVGGQFNTVASSTIINNCGLEIGTRLVCYGDVTNNAYIYVGENLYVSEGAQFYVGDFSYTDVNLLSIKDSIMNVGDNLGVIFYRSSLYNTSGYVDPLVLVTNEEDVCYIPSSICSPGYGTQPEFTLVAELNPPTLNGETLSATGVEVYDDVAYVSYHLNGEDYGSAIDVVSLSDGSPSIEQQLSSESFDFNELKIDTLKTGDTRKVWVMGSQKLSSANSFDSPAALVVFDMTDDGLLVPDFSSLTDLLGYSGNSITSFDGRLLAVSGSNGGITSMSYPDGTSPVTYPLENAKYLSAFDETAICLTASNTAANLYQFKNNDFSQASKVIELDVIQPYDGKLVVHIDEGNAYVASGQNGLKVYDIADLSEVGSYDISSGVTNGVTTDDQFVYLANGSKGLLILNKFSLTELACYDFDGSANFVTSTDNGYIFLANGRGGLKIIRRTN